VRSWGNEFVVASKIPTIKEYKKIERLFEEAKKEYFDLSNNKDTRQADLSRAYGIYIGLARARQVFWDE
jgi:hypothetical protein